MNDRAVTCGSLGVTLGSRDLRFTAGKTGTAVPRAGDDPIGAGRSDMERGPLALFGAIVAVGLGPALWMGVQLGAVQQQSPLRPPVVSEQKAEKVGQELGGTGA